MLYAPKAGQETREELASSAREGSEYVRERSRRAAEKVSDFADRGRDQLNEYVDRGKDAVDRGRSQWNQYVDRGRQAVSDQVDNVNTAVDEGKRAYQSTASADDADRISNAVEAGTGLPHDIGWRRRWAAAASLRGPSSAGRCHKNVCDAV